jgi:large subunit ribosomal protein L4
MALQVPVYSLKGEKVGTQDLNPAVFGVSFKDSLVHQTVTAQQSSGRQVLAHTKGRSEVRGGGRKPWKQKGTGRARHGSRRSPLWSGGGVTFGPTSARNFAQQINKKMRKQALRMVLSDKVKNERFVVIDEWKLDEAKTKKLNSALALLPSKGKKMTLVTKPTDKEVLRSVKNLPNVGSIGVGSLNVVDLLKREYVIIPKKLVTELEKTYAK